MTKGRTIIKSDGKQPVIWKIIYSAHLTYPSNQFTFSTFEEIRINLAINQKVTKTLKIVIYMRYI